MIDKSGIQIKRKSGNGDYMLLKIRNIYHREEETGGIRYWAADEGLRDGESYQYLVAFKDEMGKEVVKGPVSISLSCTEKDREVIAEQEKMVKEYYRKQSGRDKAVPGAPAAAAEASPYELSKEVYTVGLGSSPWKGAQEAPVTLVVFSDFECVHCGTLAESLETMLKTFPGEIKVVFKNYIIPYHKNSEYAAMAALAAGEQGKFWEMHDLLFQNHTALGKEAIAAYAGSLKLDIGKFERSLASQELKDKINRDKTQGKTLNIQNLPTTFINGRSFMGSPPADYIKSLIEELLKRGDEGKPKR
jgi:protein-disulfide isomerase